VGDLVVSGVGTNLEVLGPSDLPKLPDVDRAEECLVRERRENTAPDVRSEVDDPLYTVGIRHAKAKFWKRFNFGWSLHVERMASAILSARREAPTGCRKTGVFGLREKRPMLRRWEDQRAVEGENATQGEEQGSDCEETRALKSSLSR